MKYFVCVALLAAAAMAAPEGKRDKRGYLSSYDPWAPTYSFGHSSLDLHSFDHHSFDHHPIVHHEPLIAIPKAKIIHINKVVEVPKVVEVKKIVSVPKVVSVPQVVKVSKLVHEPEYAYASHASAGWW